MNEFDFIKKIRILAQERGISHGLVRGIGDDAAVIKSFVGTDVLVSTDLLVEDVDFRRDKTNPNLLGHKALAVSLSDIAAMGGNVGLQSSTLVIRGLATGRIELSDVRKVFFREVSIGLIIGVLCGCVALAIAGIMHINLRLGLVVGAAMMCALVVSTTMATIMPVILKHYDIDPAVAAGPFVTTANDITGCAIYLSLATVFLEYLK